MKDNKIKKLVIFAGICLLLIVTDQITKYFAQEMLVSKEYNVIEGFFYFQLVHNFGAAFGILKNARVFFCVLTIIFVILLEYLYINIPDGKRFTILKIDLILLFSGAVGNLIDRIKNGYVIDFFAFDFGDYSFPRFNCADIYVCIAAAVLFVLILFFYSDDDLKQITENWRK